MLIDPFIVIAQIINFLILVALLKHFLYQPITQAMEGRAQRIERQLATAAAKEQDAETEKKLYQQKQQELEAQRQLWLEKAKQEVAKEQVRLRQKAKAEINLVRSQWYASFEQDRLKLTGELTNRLSQQVAMMTRKALSDLANANLEAQIIETLINRLCSDEFHAKTISIPSSSNSSRVITIRSSFIIDEQQQERLISAIREQITPDAEVEFETKKDLICGIELRDCNYKISWNFDHYLTDLETVITKVLAEKNNQAA